MIVAIFSMLVSSACASNSGSAAMEGELRISGSTSMEPLIFDLATEFESLHTKVRVQSVMGDSAMGMSELLAHDVDIAALSWRDEATPLAEGVQAIPIARDAIVIIVHPDNPVSALTSLQTRALFRGEILDWSAMGGSVQEPILISREQGSGTREAFESLVMGGDRVTLNAMIMPSSQAVVDYVARHESAVGYVTMAALTPGVKALPYEGVLPSAKMLSNGAYHLERVLYLSCSDAPVPVVQAFIDFVQSSRGQRIVASHHTAIR